MTTVEELDKVSGALKAAELTLEDLEKSTAEAFNITERYTNPVDSSDFRAPFEETRQNLVRFAARELTEYPEILDVEEVLRQFRDKPFDAQAIKDYVSATFDAKADDLALAKIRKKAHNLIPWGVYNDATQRREHVVEVQGTRLKLHCWLDWSYGLRPYRLYDLAEELAALERLAWVTFAGKNPSETLKVETSFWRYGNGPQCIPDADLLKRQTFHGYIRGVKLHKNGSLYVWMATEEQARKLAEALMQEAPA